MLEDMSCQAQRWVWEVQGSQTQYQRCCRGCRAAVEERRAGPQELLPSAKRGAALVLPCASQGTCRSPCCKGSRFLDLWSGLQRLMNKESINGFLALHFLFSFKGFPF